MQAAMFLTFLINMEMYGGVGRFFYERDSVKKTMKLVSTGFWLTIGMGFATLVVTLMLKNTLYSLFFQNSDYKVAFIMALTWSPISAVYTYLLVVMRFEKKPKLYFTLVNIQLALRIMASVLFVAFLKMGVSGVVLGHVIAEFSAIVMFGVVLRKYIGAIFSFPDAKDILSFSLPLVPAVLIIGFQKPLIRYLVANLLSIDDMGLFAIAFQMAAVLSFVQFGLQMSWYPHLYELITKPDYEKEVRSIYRFFLGILAVIGLLIILNGRLMLHVLTTPGFYAASSIIGFTVINNFLDIIRQISGCGTVIVKKTKYNTYYEFVASAITISLFVLFHSFLGITGLALSFALGSLVKFLWSWQLTKRFTSISFSMMPTYLLVSIMLVTSIVFAIWEVHLYISIVLSLLLISFYTIMQRDKLYHLKSIMVNKLYCIRGADYRAK